MQQQKTMSTTRLSWLTLIIVIFLVAPAVMLASGCMTVSAANDQSESTGESAEAIFQVITSEGAVKDYTTDDLKRLALVTIMVEGKPEEGPALQEILAQAGVEEFQQLTLTGIDGHIILTYEQVNPEVILDFTNRGTMKFASPDIPKEAWVKDIVRIEVE